MMLPCCIFRRIAMIREGEIVTDSCTLLEKTETTHTCRQKNMSARLSHLQDSSIMRSVMKESSGFEIGQWECSY